MPAPDEILELVSRFGEQCASCLPPMIAPLRVAVKRWCFDEAQLRCEFVDPFFKALGWDVHDERARSEGRKDVVHEELIKVGTSMKGPDYSFCIDGFRKFFVEIGDSTTDVAHDASSAFQLRRYAWSAKLPLSIRTDFAELAVYDCRVRPEKDDPPDKAQMMTIDYDQYGDRWDEIASLLSREAILNGSFDKDTKSTRRKGGTTEVDAAFLTEIEQWRRDLARSLILHNRDLSQRALNLAVQKIIDRILFLRICEDRGIEPYGRLQALLDRPRRRPRLAPTAHLPSGRLQAPLDSPQIYPGLCELFRRAGARYNSGLFHFTPENDGMEQPDDWTLRVHVDDDVLKEILRKLYYPNGPYEFSVLGADILGQVYEQFLGKAIRLTDDRRTVPEDKSAVKRPAVKRAGGVYYTPVYIVDYIVRHTVGKLLEDKAPYDVAGRTKAEQRSGLGRPLTVLDPACGSGSFLVGAYQYLLDWYRDWYVDNGPAEHEDRVYQTRNGHWRLTTTERKRILLDHIYGVDVDAQAVEVTKLSLLLIALEGERKESSERALGSSGERALSGLADNIKCGNSLIDPAHFKNRQRDLFDDREPQRINAFCWAREFPEIIPAGGFDAVIGNPPYIKESTHRQLFRDLKHSKLGKYYQGKMDLWYVFACLAIDLLQDGGFHAFIATNNWTTSTGARILRRKLRAECQLHEVVDFGPFMAFESASVQTMIYVVQKHVSIAPQIVSYARVSDAEIPVDELRSVLLHGIASRSVVAFEAALPETSSDGPFTFVDERCARVLARIEASGTFRLAADEIAQGIVPNPDVVSRRVLGKLPTSIIEQFDLQAGDPVFVVPSDFFGDLPEHEQSFLKPTFEPSELDRYYLPENPAKRLIYLTKANDPGNLKTIKEHLSRYREIMEDRRETRLGRMQYTHLHWPRDERFFGAGPKLLCVRKCKRPVCVYTERPAYVMMAINVIRSSRIDLRLLAAILNSRLMFFWLDQRGKRQGDQLQIDKGPLQALPLFCRDSASEPARIAAEQILELTEDMAALRRSANTSRGVNESVLIQSRLDAADRQIDQLVYELYGLSGEDIRIVEEATKQ